MKLRTILGAAVFGVMFLMSGCAGKSVDVKNSGFFKEYEQFKGSTNFSAARGSKDIDMSKYRTVFISPVKVISAIGDAQQTPSQKKLYKEISDYVTDGYKREISKNSGYRLADAKGADTLILDSAISTVEVHFDDEKWNQFSPIAMDVTVISYNSYAEWNVRILGEKRIVDSATGKTMFESMDIIKDETVVLSGDTLEFENLKPALDKWIEHVKNYFAK